MNENIINELAKSLSITKSQVENTLKLLSDGNTIPFIARYRKEATNGLDEEQIRKISESYLYEVNLLKRKEDVIRLIDEKGMLTEEIKSNIMKCIKLVEVEDIYLPYKEKKKTKATEAIKNGLEPLAKIIMSFPTSFDESSLSSYLNENIKTIEDALQGAKYIIAEWISDNADYRKWLRSFIWRNAFIKSKVKKNAKDETKLYEMYYEFEELVKYVKSHRILAMNRGEDEGVLKVSIDYETDKFKEFLENKIIKNINSPTSKYVIDAISDSISRLISPSIEREIRSDLKESADETAIKVFGENLENLLLIPPMKEKVVLGFDPAYRTGCKLAIVDATSKVLDIQVIYPHEPKNEWEQSKAKLRELIAKYKIDIIAIGNGTASRESEKLVSETLESISTCKYAIVNEAGASVYSASKLAINEFPDLTVEKRSAISIARRLQDPLNELVKIDPKSIGVGQYQHDVNQKKLSESLDFVITKVVNKVGVNLNTASPFILKYISGMTSSAITKLIKYREEFGKIMTREELLKKKILSPTIFEQSIGFMRIYDGTNLLDETNIHPESYEITNNLLKHLDLKITAVGSEELIKKIDLINIKEIKDIINTDVYTLENIINSLKSPKRDFRDNYNAPILKSNILKLEDLVIGMKLQGTVRNVVDFGAFIDIGLKNDGMVHISKISNKFIKHPSEVLCVGDIVDCYVLDILKDKNKVSLSLLEMSK